MENQISVTIPMNRSALLRGSEMLAAIAADLESATVGIEPATEIVSKTVAETTPIPVQQFGYNPAPTVTEQPVQAPPAAEPPVQAPPVTEQSVQAPPVTEQPVAPTVAAGVEFADGLPWDARIHASTKTKYAKAPHGWKLKRGVAVALVEQVEAELRAAMAASPANPVEPTPTPEPEAAEVFGGTPERPAVAPTNFAELNLAITGAKIDSDLVTAAVNAAGLTNYMLLPARSDLIPFVAGYLGLGPVVPVPA